MSDNNTCHSSAQQMTVHNEAGPRIVGVLLAAGFSRRYGHDKLMQKMPSGVSVAMESLRNLQKGVGKVIAVIRPGCNDLAYTLSSEGASVVTCRESAHGMGESLSFGISATNNVDGWIIALADMPKISVATIQGVRQRLAQGCSIVVPQYGEATGHPVGFSSRWRRELLSLRGDAGAKSILEGNREEISYLPVDDKGICFDIDEPCALESLWKEKRQTFRIESPRTGPVKDLEKAQAIAALG